MMHFDFSKMRSTIVLTFVLIFMATLYVTTADNLQCMCSCCIGDGCQEQNQAMFDMSPCTDDACKTECPNKYPDICGQSDSKVDAMCMAPMTTTLPPSSTSHIFNRYTTLGAFILAFVATVMFRI
jgi:hypothetical protein